MFNRLKKKKKRLKILQTLHKVGGFICTGKDWSELDNAGGLHDS